MKIVKVRLYIVINKKKDENYQKLYKKKNKRYIKRKKIKKINLKMKKMKVRKILSLLNQKLNLQLEHRHLRFYKDKNLEKKKKRNID